MLEVDHLQIQVFGRLLGLHLWLCCFVRTICHQPGVHVTQNCVRTHFQITKHSHITISLEHVQYFSGFTDASGSGSDLQVNGSRSYRLRSSQRSSCRHTALSSRFSSLPYARAMLLRNIESPPIEQGTDCRLQVYCRPDWVGELPELSPISTWNQRNLFSHATTCSSTKAIGPARYSRVATTISRLQETHSSSNLATRLPG